jgi:hypothetical protein
MAPPTTLPEQGRARVAQQPPAPTRKERLIFTAYLAMIAMILAFLAITALVAA